MVAASMTPVSGEFPVALKHHGLASRQIKHVLGEGIALYPELVRARLVLWERTYKGFGGILLLCSAQGQVQDRCFNFPLATSSFATLSSFTQLQASRSDGFAGSDVLDSGRIGALFPLSGLWPCPGPSLAGAGRDQLYLNRRHTKDGSEAERLSVPWICALACLVCSSDEPNSSLLACCAQSWGCRPLAFWEVTAWVYMP